MKNESGLNLLSDRLKKRVSFSLYDNDGLFAKYVYDENLNRYQSDYGYLTLQGVYEISKDETDDRYIVWEGVSNE